MRLIKTYLLNCSFHGLPFIADTRFHWSERLFWTVSVVLSWGAAVYVMLCSYVQFKNRAISFIVSTSYLDWKTNFPAIVFCEKGNEKYFDYANEWLGKDHTLAYNNILQDIAFFRGTLGAISYNYCNEESCDLPEGNYSFYADAIRSKCNEIFGFCSWNNVEFSCCEQILPVNTLHGVCYGINSLVSSVKPKNPLTMTVSHTINSKIGIFAVELLNPVIDVFALSREAVPLYSSSAAMEGLASAHKNEKNNIYLVVKEIANDKDVRKTSINRRRCRFPDENYLKASKVYSYSACIIDCLIDLQIQMCNCVHHLMSIKKQNMCNMNGLLCLSDGYETAECNCATSCTETEVKIVGTTREHNFTEFQHNWSTTRVEFILPAPTLQYIRVVVNGYLDLIVSMGGTAGLCVGASLLTTVEVLYYFFIRPFIDSRRQK